MADQFGAAALAGIATIDATGAEGLQASATLAGGAVIFPGEPLLLTTGEPLLLTTGEPLLLSLTTGGQGQVQVRGDASLVGRARLVGSPPFIQSWDPTKQQAQYRVRVVDLSGDGYTDFENATISNVVWELNGIGSCTFTVPVLDPKTEHLLIPEREVQIWRGNHLLWWGVMVRAEANASQVTVQCQGLKWYLTRRFFGKVDRTNWLFDPSFEGVHKEIINLGGPIGTWTMGWKTPIEPLVGRNPSYWKFERRTDKTVLGKWSLYAEQVHPDYPKYGLGVGQQFVYEVDDEVDPEGTEWTFAVWVYIVSSKWRGIHTWGGGADDGIRISRYSTTEIVAIAPEGGGPTLIFPKPIESVRTVIDENTPQDTWVRLECTLTQPFKAGEPEWVQVAVEVPNGAIYIDAASFTQAEKTAFYDKDQALIIRGILDHAQDPNYSKTPLNISQNVPLTGIVRTREYWHSEHQVISDALDEFHTLHDGVDTDIVITPTTRTYTSYFPRKGIRRSDLVLEHGRNIETFSVVYDGNEVANSVVVLGDGAGSDREEGGAYDPDALEDGLVLERVFNAIPGSHIRTLDDQAVRGLQRLKKPVVIPSITTYEKAERLIGVLQTGDVVPVRIDHGFVQINADYRIVSISLDPRTERITYTINPADSSFVS